MGRLPILKTINRIPGDLMVVFLLLGCFTNTFVPQVFEMGGFASALFKNGALPIMGLSLFCSGAQITVQTAGVAVWKGCVLNFAKVISGVAIGVIVGRLLGPHNTWLGITPLAFVAAMSNSNGGIYTAIASRLGDESDVGAIAIIASNDGPFFEMLFMGLAGLANIPLFALIGVAIPILLGMILGNLDHDIKKFLAPGILISIPFFSFPLGAGLNMRQVLDAGGSGILLGLLTVFVTGFSGYFLYRLCVPKSHRKLDAVGAAVGTTAGNAAATPAVFAAVDSSFAAYAGSATIQVGASVIISALLCPLLVSYLAKRQRRQEGITDEEEEKKELREEIGAQL